MVDAYDAEWDRALHAAAKGLRDGDGAGAGGQWLAHRLCFGEPLSARERVDLARLVTDNLLATRHGRPAGGSHPANVQIAAAIKYEERMSDPARTQTSDEIKEEIGASLCVGGKTVGRWVTDYRKSVRNYDKYRVLTLHQTLERLADEHQAKQLSDDGYKAHVAEAKAAPDGRDIMRRLVETNSK